MARFRQLPLRLATTATRQNPKHPLIPLCPSRAHQPQVPLSRDRISCRESVLSRPVDDICISCGPLPTIQAWSCICNASLPLSSLLARDLAMPLQVLALEKFPTQPTFNSVTGNTDSSLSCAVRGQKLHHSTPFLTGSTREQRTSNLRKRSQRSQTIEKITIKNKEDEE